MRRTWIAVTVAFILGCVSQNAFAERQPRMQDALRNLRDAAASLKAANNDKGGHRAKAMSLVDQAITEVEKGIQFDNKH